MNNFSTVFAVNIAGGALAKLGMPLPGLLLCLVGFAFLFIKPRNRPPAAPAGTFLGLPRFPEAHP